MAASTRKPSAPPKRAQPGARAAPRKPTAAAEPAAKPAAPAVPVPAGAAPTLIEQRTEPMMPVKFPTYEQLAGFAKANADAYLTFGNVVTDGLEEMTGLVFDLCHQTLAQTVAATKAMMEVRTLPQILDVQSDYARNVYDLALADSAKLSELSMKVANEAVAPLNERAKEAWKTVQQSVAAA